MSLDAKSLAGYALIVVLVWLPLPFGSNQAMYWYSAEIMIQLLSLGVLALFTAGRLSVSDPFKQSWPVIGLFALFLLLQVTLAFVPGLPQSADQHATYAQLIKTLCLFQLFCLMFLLFDSEKQLRVLVWALIISGTFQAVYGTLMTVTGTDYIWNYPKVAYKGVATGTFVNRNHLAGYLEMTLALGLGLMIASLNSSKSRTWRQFFRSWTETLLGEKVRIRVCLVLMVIGLILTRSRMGNTAFFVGMGIAGLIGLFVFRKSQSGVVALFVSILIIDIFLLGTFFGIEELQARLQQTDIQEEQRITAVLLSAGLLEMAPWFGHGLGTFYTVFPQVRNDEISLLYQHAHADVMQFPVELGAVGVLPLVLLLVLTFGAALKAQLTRRNRFSRAMGFSATMAMISIGLHSTTDFNLQIFANAATFVCVLAIPWLALYMPRSSRRSSEI